MAEHPDVHTGDTAHLVTDEGLAATADVETASMKAAVPWAQRSPEGLSARGGWLALVVLLAFLAGCLELMDSPGDLDTMPRIHDDVSTELVAGVPLISFEPEGCNPSGAKWRAGTVHNLPDLDGTRQEVAERVATLLGQSVHSWSPGYGVSHAELENGYMRVWDQIVIVHIEGSLFEPEELAAWTENLLASLGAEADDGHHLEFQEGPLFGGGNHTMAHVTQRVVLDLQSPHQGENTFDRLVAKEAFVRRSIKSGNVTTDMELGLIFDLRDPGISVDIDEIVLLAREVAHCWLESEGRGGEELRPGHSSVWLDVVPPEDQPGSVGLGMMFKLAGETESGLVENIKVTLDAYTHAVLDLGHGMATS